MTPDFKTALRILGWDQYAAAENLGKSLRSINGYANGGKVPLLVERELQRLLTAKPALREGGVPRASKPEPEPVKKPVLRGPFT